MRRRLGLLYLLPGLRGVDPFPDAFDDCRMSRDCLHPIGQDVEIDKTFPDECGGEVLVLLFEPDELGQDTGRVALGTAPDPARYSASGT